jgi:hypothetical protein
MVLFNMQLYMLLDPNMFLVEWFAAGKVFDAGHVVAARHVLDDGLVLAAGKVGTRESAAAHEPEQG